MSDDTMNDIFLEAMKSKTLAPSENIINNKLHRGKVVAISETDVFLDMGSKSEAVVPLEEFDVKPSIGDTVDVIFKEVKEGVMIASRLEAEKLKKINEIKNAYKQDLGVKGVIQDVILKNGEPKGFNVDLGFGMVGFLPISQIDLRNKNTEELKGVTLDFSILEYQRNNITLSRKKYLSSTIQKLYSKFFANHKVGDILKAKVEKVEKDYLLLECEGINLFMHISDFSWKFLQDLRKVVKIGDELEAEIISMDENKRSVKVSRKKLIPDPWNEVAKKYSLNQLVKGKVVSFKKDGAIVEIEEGVEAFLPVDELSWTKKIKDPKEVLRYGNIVKVKIVNIDVEKRKMLVSLRELYENPWDKAAENYPVGKKVEGKITSVLDFGLFIQLNDGIEGLMRKEDVDWLDQNINLKSKFKKGQKISAIVLSVDPEKEKLRLGYKQLSENPYKTFSLNYPKGSPVSGKIKRFTNDGVYISLENNLEGFVPVEHISKEKVEDPKSIYKEGDEVNAIVKYVDVGKQKIELSIKDYLIMEEKKETEKYLIENTEDINKIKMGNILKEKLKNLKVE